MDSISRTKHRFGKMINSAVTVISNSASRRRQFARSATINSSGPIPVDGDSSVPLMYSSQRSNSTTSSTHSIVSIPGYGTVSNLIQVRSLEQSMEAGLNVNEQREAPGAQSSSLAVERPAPSVSSALSILHGFIKVAEYMYITDNKDLLDGDSLASIEISHLISVGDEHMPVASVTRKDGLLVIIPLTLIHETNINPNQPFRNLVPKFDNLNLFIENARSICQKVVIYSSQKALAYFVVAQYNIDYYELEAGKAVHHLMKVTGAEWVDLPDKCMKRLGEWRELGKRRRSERPSNDRRLSISVRSVPR